MMQASPTSRRGLLKLAASGSVATLTSLSGCVNFQIPKPPASGSYSHHEYTLGAKTTGWRGIEPKEISGDLNPELKFRPGKSIRIKWKNLDGVEHKFVIEDSEEETLEETDPASERGATRTVTFESSQEMTTYVCPFHPIQMTGDVLCTKE